MNLLVRRQIHTNRVLSKRFCNMIKGSIQRVGTCMCVCVRARARYEILCYYFRFQSQQSYVSPLNLRVDSVRCIIRTVPLMMVKSRHTIAKR